MEQQQDHVCKVCNASFLSGRILGGHMRNHLAKRKVKIETFDMGIDQGYGLRENPKKSWKKSSSGFNFNHHTDDDPDSVILQDNDVKCSVCGKQFGSPRSLHGHMRHHSVEERCGIRCKDCGKGFRSLRSLTGHMRLHSGKQRKMMMMIDGGGGESSSRPPNLVVSMSLTTDSDTTVSHVRKKRSDRMRYYKAKSTPNSSFSSLNDQSVYASDLEMEPEVEEVAMTLMLLSRGLYNLGVSKHKITECSSACNEEMGVEFEAPIESGLVSYDPETQKDTDESEESQDFIEFDVDEIKERNEFQCRICSKNFATYQALGGHQTFHRTAKSFMIHPNPPDETIEHKKDAIMEVEDEVSSVKEHKCHICCKKFVSGQALGGHKRAHIAAKTKEEQSLIAVVKQEIYECYKHEALLVDVMAKAKNVAVVGF